MFTTIAFVCKEYLFVCMDSLLYLFFSFPIKMDALAGKVAATFQAQNESRDRA
jgi:hypothetical protein